MCPTYTPLIGATHIEYTRGSSMYARTQDAVYNKYISADEAYALIGYS